MQQGWSRVKFTSKRAEALMWLQQQKDLAGWITAGGIWGLGAGVTAVQIWRIHALKQKN